MQDRQKKILKAVVKEYQRTGQPVSSQYLMKRWHFDFSPATVRAEMLELDEQGFLKQPHISAGRLPTDKAWRFFIEELLDDINQTEKELIWQRLAKIHKESLRETAQFLAECSRGLGLSGIFGPAERGKPYHDWHSAGFKWLAEEPEFADDGFKNILKCFDSLENDFSRFFRGLDEEVEIFIGQENPIKYLRDCSLMITGFDQAGGEGVMGILGSKRMNYQKNKFVLEETRKRVKTSKQANK
jgi:heat-inducible transcriptional repressor